MLEHIKDTNLSETDFDLDIKCPLCNNIVNLYLESSRQNHFGDFAPIYRWTFDCYNCDLFLSNNTWFGNEDYNKQIKIKYDKIISIINNFHKKKKMNTYFIND